MKQETSVMLHDLRNPPGQDGYYTDLGEARRFFLRKDGRLEIETVMAYEIDIHFSQDDLHRLRHRLIEIRKSELEQIAKRRAKAIAKAEAKVAKPSIP